MNAREGILQRLKAAPKKPFGPRPFLPPLRELALTEEEKIRKFSACLKEETGIVHRVKDTGAALERLGQVMREEKVQKVLASRDEVLAPLDLPFWGRRHGVEIWTPQDFPRGSAFKKFAFQEADAGLTGADFAVAESGTLVLVHRPEQARLVSLAPVLHIALVPLERMVSIYEEALEQVFADGKAYPSQVTFITGPSQTGDIQATNFKGMHGPRKVIVILIG